MTKLDGKLTPEHFNSQPHEEADLPFLTGFQQLYYFNSQPHEEADCHRNVLSAYNFYFNSQPHEEADGGAGRNEC